MKLCEFDYYLPKELFAQSPIEPRDESRLKVAVVDCPVFAALSCEPDNLEALVESSAS